VVLQVAKLVTKLVPEKAVRSAVELSYSGAEKLAGRASIARQAGVEDIAELRRKPLDECDRLAKEVAMATMAVAAVEGAVTGAGGAVTTLIDVPLLFGSALRTIVRTRQREDCRNRSRRTIGTQPRCRMVRLCGACRVFDDLSRCFRGGTTGIRPGLVLAETSRYFVNMRAGFRHDGRLRYAGDSSAWQPACSA
jgi:hypothetical protein